MAPATPQRVRGSWRTRRSSSRSRSHRAPRFARAASVVRHERPVSHLRVSDTRKQRPSHPARRERISLVRCADCQALRLVETRRVSTCPDRLRNAPGRIRTSDQRIRSPPLCPLSYGRLRGGYWAAVSAYGARSSGGASRSARRSSSTRKRRNQYAKTAKKTTACSSAIRIPPSCWSPSGVRPQTRWWAAT